MMSKLEIIIIVLSVGVLLVFWGKGRSSFMRALREFRDVFEGDDSGATGGEKSNPPFTRPWTLSKAFSNGVNRVFFLRSPFSP
jgi:hypothetical protein